METAETIDRARAAYADSAWDDAYRMLSEVDLEGGLCASDLERLGTAAYLTGRDDASVHVLGRAYHAFLDAEEFGRSARCAFWLGITLILRGQHAQGAGWLGRAGQVVDQRLQDSVEQGYMLIARGLELLGSDPVEAAEVLGQVSAIASDFGDPDLRALGGLGRGQALAAAGDVKGAMALLDDAMLCVTSDGVSPLAAGIVYCAVILCCRDVFDIRRAEEWTTALSSWCSKQQGLHPYQGQCLVHRSEIMQLRGRWADALAEVDLARRHLSTQPGDPVLGMALYQQAEILRLRGRHGRAEAAYREAAYHGHPVHPGLALLRLAERRTEEAYAAIRRVAAETSGRPVERARILTAYVPIALAAGEGEAAREAAEELSEIAERFDSPYLRAVASSMRGSILFAECDLEASCRELRTAWAAWREVAAPYEGARLRVALAKVYQAQGDADSARVELEAASRVFRELGAEPDLQEVIELSPSPVTSGTGGLSPREVEVLRLVARGMTNRDIAATLVISEKTVARHLSNILAKLSVPSRTAAAAYAYTHDLVEADPRARFPAVAD